MSADKLNLVVVWREAPQFSARERAALAWTEALTMLTGGVSDEVYAEASAEFSEKELAYLTLGDRLDQCLEQVRRRLSLDAAGAAEAGPGGRVITSALAYFCGPYRRSASRVRPLPTAPKMSPSTMRAAGTALVMALRTWASLTEPPVRNTASMSSAESCAWRGRS